jgi:hypothetical protein
MRRCLKHANSWGSQMAAYVLERIRELHAVEREGKELDTPERHELRQKNQN